MTAPPGDSILVRHPVTNFHINKELQTVVNTMKETEWESGGENFLAEATDSAKVLG